MEETLKKTIQMHPDDNVVVAISDIPAQTAFGVADVASLCGIPAGHKIAIRPLNLGDPILKYGQIIGFASEPILPGEHVHTHNVKMEDFDRVYAFGEDAKRTDMVPVGDRATFKGIVRKNGQVGTRNYIGIIATVSCSASVAKWIAEAFDKAVMGPYPNVDGVVALVHGAGCTAGFNNESFDLLQKTIAGYARNPNFAEVLLVGLGCEGNHLDCLMANTGLQKGANLRTLDIQLAGGTAATVAKGISIVKEMVERSDKVQRKEVSAENLMVGLECGGSDAYSGITANPVLGAAVDILVQHGGTAILSETPEIYGAEQLLTRRAESRLVGEQLLDRIHWWESHTAQFGGSINNNPSPGNKAGGLTTILEKSLGAAAKGGGTNLKAVYGYGETVSAGGLVFMDTPGYDPASVAGMIAGGANLICFTTGRGTVIGFKPSPTIKMASNSALYQRMKNDMDMNCGGILEGVESIQTMGKRLFHLILKTASGEATRSEAQGFGDNEFVPWQFGPMM
ncbi:MAG: altronate dehydratase family protein [Deltaproteobacteria bacterium]|nr:altronate dehydratase family protein [Deltaproteobacteria bacterium]